MVGGAFGAANAERGVMEFTAAEIESDLTDLAEVPLAELDAALDAAPAADTLRRVAPSDGTRLLVAASFNSAI